MLWWFIRFFFNDTATTEIYTLSLHDALPIWGSRYGSFLPCRRYTRRARNRSQVRWGRTGSIGGRMRRRKRSRLRPRSKSRSEEHTSELQSRQYLVCRLLLEKKNTSPFSSLTC